MNLVNIWQAISIFSLAKNADIISVKSFSHVLAAATIIVMTVSILNSLGRIAWGKISDNTGRKKTLLIIFLLCGLTLLFLNSLTAFTEFIVGVSIVGFCFGGFLALYPAITADYFGTKNVGANYGLMFSAYGMGGLIGPWLAPKLISNVQQISYETLDKAGAVLSKSIEIGSYANSFLLTGILCLAAAFLISRLKQTTQV
jgi:OFA family oxalate/formate antiporter-like MFS transporter